MTADLEVTAEKTRLSADLRLTAGVFLSTLLRIQPRPAPRLFCGGGGGEEKGGGGGGGAPRTHFASFALVCLSPVYAFFFFNILFFRSPLLRILFEPMFVFFFLLRF